jgi:membrane protein YqaA with SNARE-associated domain
MFFAKLYQRCMIWARSRYAVHILALISFIESIFFPIPPDVMLAPMAMAKPERAVYYATITTVFSVLGGIVGYYLGVWAFPTLVEPFLQQMNYMDKYAIIHAWFDEWGFWVVFIAGFSPIPYKLFTVTAGLAGVGFLPFVIASVTSRGLRFFLVSILMAKGGPKLENFINDMLIRFGWAMVGLFCAIVTAVYFLH